MYTIDASGNTYATIKNAIFLIYKMSLPLSGISGSKILLKISLAKAWIIKPAVRRINVTIVAIYKKGSGKNQSRINLFLTL
jgi:hypothetical protein